MKQLILFFSIAMIAFSCGGQQTSTHQESKPEGKVALDQNKAEVKQISADAAKADLAAYSLLDVRTPGEWEGGIISGADKLDFNGSGFREGLDKLDRNKKYLVYCAVGGRSSQAAKQMVDMGFTDVTNLQGGINAWKSAGGETVK